MARELSEGNATSILLQAVLSAKKKVILRFETYKRKGRMKCICLYFCYLGTNYHCDALRKKTFSSQSTDIITPMEGSISTNQGGSTTNTHNFSR